MAETTKVTLKQLLDISKTFKNIVCRSFGPRCQTTLLATSTGQIMVTTDGIKILKSLNIGHPIGRLIVQAVSAHHKVYADGVKTFLLYLCEFLHQLEALQEDSPINLILVSKNISKFINEILPKCLENFKSAGLLLLNSKLFFPLELDHYTTDFVKTTLAPNLRKSQVKLFSNLFSNVIMNGSNSLTRILERADLFCDFFDYLHIKMTGPYSESKVLSGILLRPFSCSFLDVSKSNLNFVILRNSIEGNKTPEPDEIVRLSSEDSLNACVMSPIKVAEDFLKKLNSLSIDLILMSEKVPHFVVNLCRKYQISVIERLDDQEINLVEMLSSTSSLSSVFDDISERNFGQTNSCEKMKCGKHVYTNLHFSNCLYIKSFILCAPTEGLVHELSSLIYKSFKSVQSSAAQKGELSILSNLVSTQSEVVCGTKVTCSEEIVSPLFLHKGAKNFGDQLFDSIETSCLKIYESHNEIGKPENIRPASNPSVVLLPAGGYFEFQLAKYIRESTGHFKALEFGELGKLIFETLLAVPRHLHSNLCERTSNEKRHFLEILQEVLNSDSNMCLNSRGHVYSPSEDCDTLESLNLKIGSLCNVLQLIQQLLRLDMIIGVKSFKP